MAKVTLTFDNGPTTDVTPLVLDVLRSHDILASFYVIGRKLAEPDARKCSERAKGEGHWIANHSYTHTVSLGDGPASAFDDEVTKTQNELGDLAHPDKLFRPYCNSGVLDKRVLKRRDSERLAEEKYTCVLFNSLPRDWEDAEGWIERGLGEINSCPWSTMVLHDISKSGAMNNLDRFINMAKDQGHEFVQELTPECVPIWCGEVLQSMDPYISDQNKLSEF